MINRLRNYLNDRDSRIGKINYITINPVDYKAIRADRDYCRTTDTFCNIPVVVNSSLRKGDMEVR